MSIKIDKNKLAQLGYSIHQDDGSIIIAADRGNPAISRTITKLASLFEFNNRESDDLHTVIDNLATLAAIRRSSGVT